MADEKIGLIKFKIAKKQSVIRNAEHNYLTASVSVYASLIVLAVLIIVSALATDSYTGDARPFITIFVIDVIMLFSADFYRRKAHKEWQKQERNLLDLQIKLIEGEHGKLPITKNPKNPEQKNES